MEHNISDVHFRIYFFSSSLAVTFGNKKKNLPGFIYTFKIFEIKKEFFFFLSQFQLNTYLYTIFLKLNHTDR